VNIQRAYRVLLLIVFVCIFSTLLQAQKAEYLIVNEPDYLHILDNYEQRMPESSLLPFSPFKIINKDVILSDDYTNALKVSLTTSSFYIVKDNDGKIFTSRSELKLIKYQNTTSLYDTIRVRTGKELEILFPDIKVNESIIVKEGTRLQRIFNTRSLIYVFLPGKYNKYGWIRMSDSQNWETFRPTNIFPDKDSFEITFNQIRSKTEEVNLLYTKIFEYMNIKSGRTDQPPQWQISEDMNKLILQFTPQRHQQQFNKSITKFIQEIKYLLPDSDYTILLNNNSSQIEINAR